MSDKFEVYEGGNFIDVGLVGYKQRVFATRTRGFEEGGRLELTLRFQHTPEEFAEALALAKKVAAVNELVDSLTELVLRREKAAEKYVSTGAVRSGSDGRYDRARAALEKAGVL